MHPNPCRSYLPALLLSGLLLIAACTTTQQDAAEAEEAAKSAERRQHAPSPPVAEAPTAEGLAMSADLDFASQNRYAPPVDREGYAAIVENDFKRPTDTPLSTFSIDVDAASYANVRRFLDGGALPVHDAVRIEELVNYFEYDYPDPEGEHPFAVVTEVSECPWAPDHRLVHIGLQGERIDTRDLPPSNLVFLMDVSGSMNSPDKLPLLKQAFALLTDNLREQDRVGIVVYAGAAGVVLEPTNDRQAILDALDRLEAGGSTAGGEGIKLAYALARKHFDAEKNNRVILATDGDFNVGASSDAEMMRLVERERASGVFLSVLGFGTGNLQDSKMETIADHGNGHYAYIDSISEARKVLVNEMGGTLVTIAKDVKVQVEFNPAHVAAYRLVGYENRLLADEDFNDDTKDAGELGAGHSVTALYEIVPVGVENPAATVDELKYQQRHRDALATAHEPRVADGQAPLQAARRRHEPPARHDAHGRRHAARRVVRVVPVRRVGGGVRAAAAGLGAQGPGELREREDARRGRTRHGRARLPRRVRPPHRRSRHAHAGRGSGALSHPSPRSHRADALRLHTAVPLAEGDSFSRYRSEGTCPRTATRKAGGVSRRTLFG